MCRRTLPVVEPVPSCRVPAETVVMPGVGVVVGEDCRSGSGLGQSARGAGQDDVDLAALDVVGGAAGEGSGAVQRAAGDQEEFRSTAKAIRY